MQLSEVCGVVCARLRCVLGVSSHSQQTSLLWSFVCPTPTALPADRATRSLRLPPSLGNALCAETVSRATGGHAVTGTVGAATPAGPHTGAGGGVVSAASLVGATPRLDRSERKDRKKMPRSSASGEPRSAAATKKLRAAPKEVRLVAL